MAKIMGVDTVVLGTTESADIAVASTATVYTKSMHISKAEYLSVSYKATSASGAPDLKIELQMGATPPSTEGSADNNWVEPENTSDIEASLTTETMHHKAINPPALPYIRFKITGNAANPADTILNMKLNKQEDF